MRAELCRAAKNSPTRTEHFSQNYAARGRGPGEEVEPLGVHAGRRVGSAAATRAPVAAPTIARARLVLVARVACCPQVRRDVREIRSLRSRDDLVDGRGVPDADPRRPDLARVAVALQDGRPDLALPFPARRSTTRRCAFTLPRFRVVRAVTRVPDQVRALAIVARAAPRCTGHQVLTCRCLSRAHAMPLTAWAMTSSRSVTLRWL